MKNYRFLFFFFFFLFFSLMEMPLLFAQSPDEKIEQEGSAFQTIKPLPPIDSFPEAPSEEEAIFFAEDKENFSPVLLMIEPLTPRFGFWDKNRDPFSIGNSETPSLAGSRVAKPRYIPQKNSDGVVVADVNQEFAFDREYLFSLASQFRVLPWLTMGVGFGFGYEHLPFVCNLPDPQEVASLSPSESINSLKKYPTYYSIAVQNSTGAILGRLTSEDFIDSHGNEFFSASLAYGVYRIELVPSIQFYPLQNAGEDLKGLFIEVAPVVGLSVDSPMKVYLDILYEANKLRFITTDAQQSINPISLIHQTIRQSENWKIIQDTINKSSQNPFVHFFGGIRLNWGFQGTFDNGLVLHFSSGVGIDNSRGFYLQLKSSIGYCFR